MDHNDLRDHDARRRADDADTVRTVKLTPTWAGVLRLLLETHKSGTDHGRQLALTELYRMARLADAYVADHPDE